MPTPAPLENVQALSHPLGQEIDVIWTLPSTLPDEWKIVVLSREGSDISQSEIDQYFAGQPFDDIEKFEFLGLEFPEIRGFPDFSVSDNKVYYYQAVLEDLSDSARTDGVGANTTSLKEVNASIVDAKAQILVAVERIMTSYGMVKDKQYQLFREYAMPGMIAPTIYVTRVGGSTYQKYIGHFTRTNKAANAQYGQIEMDNIQVVWEDPNAVRRDTLTNIFRETKEFLHQYLLAPTGGNMLFVDVRIEGDVINEAVKDRVQIGGMMLISCGIETTASMPEKLASWLEGKGIPVE